MPQVVLSDELGRQFAGGLTHFEIEGATVRQLVRQLDAKFPGLGAHLQSDAIAVAIDGEIFNDAMMEEVKPASEVYFIPSIRGG